MYTHYIEHLTVETLALAGMNTHLVNHSLTLSVLNAKLVSEL
jgi:hypothetical protein